MKYFLFLSLTTMIFLSCAGDSTTKSVDKQKESISKEQMGLTEAERTKFIAEGKKIAQASFKALGGNLKKAMKAGGPPKAIEFCNLNAVLLVDSLQKAHNAIIRRTSSKLRSLANTPTEIEAAQLATYAKNIAEKQPLKPQLKLTKENKVTFFAPIKIPDPVCLKCHGTVGETMKPAHAMLIKERYPDDQATGYKAGAFRGIWSIEFER